MTLFGCFRYFNENGVYVRDENTDSLDILPGLLLSDTVGI